MALFAISYDLIKRKDYQTLWDELERLKAQKVQLSLYLADLNNTAKEVLDHLLKYVDEDDRVMVIEFSKRPQYNKALLGTMKWIEAHFG